MPIAYQETEDLLDELPPEVIDRLPPDIVERLRDGAIEKIPEDVVELLPPDIQDRIPSGLLESASANPVLTIVLIAVGVAAALLFFYGLVKSAFKAALFAAVVGGGAWFWYFNIR